MQSLQEAVRIPATKATIPRAAEPTPPARPDPDTPEDPNREGDLPDVNPGSNPDNPGDTPGVTEPGRPAEVVAGPPRSGSL